MREDLNNLKLGDVIHLEISLEEANRLIKPYNGELSMLGHEHGFTSIKRIGKISDSKRIVSKCMDIPFFKEVEIEGAGIGYIRNIVSRFNKDEGTDISVRKKDGKIFLYKGHFKSADQHDQLRMISDLKDSFESDTPVEPKTEDVDHSNFDDDEEELSPE